MINKKTRGNMAKNIDTKIKKTQDANIMLNSKKSNDLALSTVIIAAILILVLV